MSQECHSLLLPQEGRWEAQVATLSYDFRSGHVIPEHFHPEDQLVFASRGVMTVRTKPGIWVVPPLRAVWIPARTPHSITVSGAVSMRTMYFLPKLITDDRGSIGCGSLDNSAVATPFRPAGDESRASVTCRSRRTRHPGRPL